MSKAKKEAPIEVWEVTPAMAKEWLDTRYDNERPLRPTHVDRLARDMVNGNWHFDGTPIRFDKETGQLIDGQHRLTALVKSNTTQWFAVLWLPAEVRRVLDTGESRSLSDALHYDSFGAEVGVGSHVRGRELAALVNRLLRYRNNLGTGGGGVYKPTHSEGLEFFQENSDRLLDALVVARKAHGTELPVAPSSLASAYYLCAEVDKTQAWDFFVNQILGGLELTENSPAQAYRAKAIRYLKNSGNKLPTDDVFRFAITAWNHERKGNQVSKLQPPRGGWNRTNLPKPV